MDRLRSFSVDEIVLAQVEIGDVDEMRLEFRRDGGERGVDRRRAALQAFDRAKFDG